MTLLEVVCLFVPHWRHAGWSLGLLIERRTGDMQAGHWASSWSASLETCRLVTGPPHRAPYWRHAGWSLGLLMERHTGDMQAGHWASSQSSMLQTDGNLTSTTRRSSAAMRVIRNSVPETERARCCFCFGDDTDDYDEEQTGGGQNVLYDEKQGTIYSYTYFHFVFFLGSLYVMMTIEKLLDGSWSVFWIKMASCWVCLILYMWTLLAPMVCPKRFEA
ncbi:unnamed protein product [Coregonus sp. 'balchen']|nr:unnamed protein product [Coregonus sp. 'balchen']